MQRCVPNDCVPCEYLHLAIWQQNSEFNTSIKCKQTAKTCLRFWHFFQLVKFYDCLILDIPTYTLKKMKKCMFAIYSSRN
ncbi:hypothetical protein JTE90_025841 [Oedothorax gibbosus]|uniref:Uncharacterized protein n=1 Tax=Oedothorax gibbosus TaxID=931172 RepID=A0AAV6UVD1_9ARAC|nr:hypothetical protein JTE90_025841 [Oedothorax gibbosus]